MARIFAEKYCHSFCDSYYGRKSTASISHILKLCLKLCVYNTLCYKRVSNLRRLCPSFGKQDGVALQACNPCVMVSENEKVQGKN